MLLVIGAYLRYCSYFNASYGLERVKTTDIKGSSRNVRVELETQNWRAKCEPGGEGGTRTRALKGLGSSASGSRIEC